MARVLHPLSEVFGYPAAATESHISALTFVMVIIVLGIGVIASMIRMFNLAHGEFVLPRLHPACFSSTSGLCGAQLSRRRSLVRVLVGALRGLIIIDRVHAKSIITMPSARHDQESNCPSPTIGGGS